MDKRYRKLTILHSNDMHGDFFAEKIDNLLVGGVSFLSGYINSVREKEENVLYCVAGDMFRGSIIDTEHHGLSTIEIMNMLKPDIVTIGNHETDYGLTHLLFIDKCANFPIINTNIYVKMSQTRLFEPYRIFEIDGMKILFIGITTEEVIANTKTHDEVVGALIDIYDAAKEIGRICNSVNALDIDLTVLLTHIGWKEDHKLAEILDPSWGVDIIIGGHSHTFIDKPDVVNNILIAQAGTGTDQIGRFDIIIDTLNNNISSYEWSCVPINENNCPKDLKIEELILKMKKNTEGKYTKVITRFKHILKHPSRYEQTSLGSVYDDILLDAYGVDIMLINSGSIRVKEVGPILTYKDLIESFPYSESSYCIKLKGEQFKRLLKYTYRDSVWNVEHNEFFQLSRGLKVIYTKSRHELLHCSLNGIDIDDNRVYKVGIQKYPLDNFKECFGLDIEEVKENGEIKQISSSNQDVLYERLLTNNYIETRGLGRLEILD